MTAILYLSLINASVGAFILSLLTKWGVIEWLQVHGSDLVSRMANCWFCLSWWVNVLLAILAMIVTQHWECMAIPFIATPITRQLL